MDSDFQLLYEKYGPMVYRRCLALLGDEARADDAMHDVFVNVMQNKTRVDWRGPSSYLYTVATNVCITAMRKQATRERYVQPDNGELLYNISCITDLEQQTVATRVLDWLFSRHPVSSQAIAVMHYVDGLSFDEVAEETGMSASGVRKRIYKMRKELRLLENEGDGYGE